MKKKALEKYSLPLLLATGILLAGGPVFAQERGTAGGIVSPAQVGTRLQDNDRQLASIEQLFTRIEAAKLITDNYADELSVPLAAYAKAMMESFDTAIKQAELAAKSQGKEGSTALLKPFEDLAVKHENRMKQLDMRAQKIVLQIKEGAVQIDKSLLQQLTPQERGEFLQTLHPRGVKEMEQRHPELFKEPPKPKGQPSGRKSSSTAEPAEGGKVARGWPMLEKISDFFISPAQAAIAIPVTAACTGPAVVFDLCGQATLIASNQISQAQTTFTACWNAAHGGGNKHWKHFHWKATMQTACTAVLVARLA
ncbi:MAG: hypothetical protein HYU33_05725 [Candidatus Omnitrophica bacterium]|nr:hypothetical protein [Candidatus Omnitrophota bacterium]